MPLEKLLSLRTHAMRALCILFFVFCSTTFGAVDLELRPFGQTVSNGSVVNLGLYAVSDSGANQPVGRIRAIISWNPSFLRLSATTDNGPYTWASSYFPDDSDGDNLNGTFDDGNALYEAVAQIGAPAQATPSGLLVTTFHFAAVETTPLTTVAMSPQIGGTATEVLNALGANVTGGLGSSTVTIICSTAAQCNDGNPCTDDSCASQSCQHVIDDTNNPNDGLYCNGVEDFCQSGTIVYLTPPPDCDDGLSCTTDFCNEALDECESALQGGNCLISATCLAGGTVNPGNQCEICDPSTSTMSWSPRPAGTACGSSADSGCDNPDSCNTTGTCLPNNEPNGLSCQDDGNPCTDDVCNGGICGHPPRIAGTPCGNSADTVCTNPDTCNGAGTCQSNHEPNGTVCDDGAYCSTSSNCVSGICTGFGTPCSDDLICDEVTDSCKGVDFEWRPFQQTVAIGDTVEIGLYAVSATGADQSFNSATAILLWDANALLLVGNVDNGPYSWVTSGFPNDCTLDGLNAPCTGVPQNDGNAYYIAIGQFQPAEPAVATPAGLLVSTFQFLAADSGVANVSVGATFGMSTQTQVFDGETPNLNIVRSLGSPSQVNILECFNNGHCSDGLFCTGVETCAGNMCIAGTNPCTPRLCDEVNNVCVDCLQDIECDDEVFCNGAEICMANGTCGPGSDPCPGPQLCDDDLNQCVECLTAADCNDGIACTANTCVSGTCVYVPNHAFCQDSSFCNGPEVCNLTLGCVSSGNPCPDPDSCDDVLDRCANCDVPTVEGIGSRYLSITPPQTSPVVGLRIVGDPEDEEVSCVEVYVQGGGTVEDSPVFRAPQDWGTMYVRGEALLPNKKYFVHADCRTGPSPRLSAGVPVWTWPYGDVNGSSTTDTDDLLLVLEGFRGDFSNGTLEGMDQLDCLPNETVDLDDILAVVEALEGSNLPCQVLCLFGACCFGPVECEDNKTPEECAQSGGLYGGPATQCAQGACQSVPTMSLAGVLGAAILTLAAGAWMIRGQRANFHVKVDAQRE